MTFIVAAIFVHDPGDIPAVLDRAREAAENGAQLIEWRIDALAEESDAAAHIKRLLRDSPLPCILTCRPEWEGGQYTGDEQTRVSLFEDVCASDYPPRFIDIELAAYTRSENFRQKVNLCVDHARQPRDLKTSLILSTHDFTGRPRDLLQRVERMTGEDACAMLKVVWAARSIRDNLEAFDLIRERAKPTTALCMGYFGLMSRVLAAKYRGLLTYAADIEGEGTAPGQPTIRELRERYRFESIDRDTKVYGVIGWPVEHSRGPVIHNAGFDAVEHNGVYLPMPVPAEYEHFKATVGSFIDHRRLDFRGASVTLPHKEHLVRFVLERGGRVDPLAETIGAANTLVVGSAGGLSCMNSDCAAAIDTLCDAMEIEPGRLAGRRIALIGAGGVARAVVVGLLQHDAHVTLFNRSQDKAESLAKAFANRHIGDGNARVQIGQPGDLGDESFAAYINCTSIGMTNGPAPDSTPFEVLTDRDVPLDDSVTVFDTVYTPVRTPFIREAEARGARIASGLDMFLRQAVIQFEQWTGKPAPVGIFRNAMTIPSH